jgi:hypothetical protein
MKRVAVALAFFLSCGGSLLADTTAAPPPGRAPVLQEIVRMTRAGYSEDMVLAYARAHRPELPSRVSDADLRWLEESGVGNGVVRYLWAVDVRLPDGSQPGGADYGTVQAAPFPYGEYPPEGERSGSSAADGYVGYDSGSSSSDDNGFYNFWYTPYFNSWYSPYDCCYGYSSYYPYYAHSPYAPFRGHGFHGGHHVDHRDGGHGHWGHGGGSHGRSGDAWRDRGAVAGRGAPMMSGSRGSARPAFSRGGFARAPRGPRASSVGRGGPSPPAVSRGGMPHGTGAPRGTVARGGFGHGGSSGGRSVAPAGGHAGRR